MVWGVEWRKGRMGMGCDWRGRCCWMPIGWKWRGRRGMIPSWGRWGVRVIVGRRVMCFVGCVGYNMLAIVGSIHRGVTNANVEEEALHANPDEEYDFFVKKMKQTYCAKEVEADMAMVEREQEDVMALIREGTAEVDIDEAVRIARERMRRTQQELMQEIEAQTIGNSSTEVDASTVPK
mmetsp:Transcript_6309/g.7213  ORF Transcript_6309/g.7213 Transcript_6309/m.7213 type:complete len:179 (-) Transcript_6309:82-618(-)